MRIMLNSVENDNIVAEFKIGITNNSYILIPYIYDESFAHLLSDLTFIRTKWLTYCLQYMRSDVATKEPEEMLDGLIDDVLKMLEQEVIFQRVVCDGSYKIVCKEM